MGLKVEDLSFSRSNRTIFQGLSFSVEKGQMTAVMGPNGVGKTTLLRCIGGILSPTRGSVAVDGVPVSSMTRLQCAKVMAYVPQFAEPQHMTVFDSVLLGRRPHLTWRVSEKDIDIVEKSLRLLDLWPFRLRFMDQLSGGERQKVAVARALAQEPKVMLLDEVTSSLDMKNKKDLMTALSRIVKDQGLCAVASIHDVNLALRHGDRCLFMKDWEETVCCSPCDVTGDTIERIYGLKADVLDHKGFPVVILGG